MSLNKEKKLSSAFFTKLCPTTGIMIFLIRETLEYIGIFSNNKNPPTPNKLAKFYQSVIENNGIKLEKIRDFFQDNKFLL